jgi:hypothetical protein
LFLKGENGRVLVVGFSSIFSTPFTLFLSILEEEQERKV